MAVFMVETYIVKPEKQGEFIAMIKKWVEGTKKSKEKYKELKSYKLFAHMFGGSRLGYSEMWEFENLADLEKLLNRLMQDKEFQTILSEFVSQVVPDSWSISIWNPVT